MDIYPFPKTDVGEDMLDQKLQLLRRSRETLKDHGFICLAIYNADVESSAGASLRRSICASLGTWIYKKYVELRIGEHQVMSEKLYLSRLAWIDDMISSIETKLQEPV